MKKRVFIFLCFVLLGFHSIPTIIDAQENVPFTVDTIFPENQDKNIKGYYKLRVEPNEKQTIYLKVINNLDTEQKMLIEAVNAYTNPKGGIIYRKTLNDENAQMLNDSIKLDSYMEVENEITLKPKESREIPIQITVPNLESGTLLGGITVKSGEQQTYQGPTPTEGEANFIVKTEIQHAIAIQLDLPNQVTPDFSLGKAGFNLQGPSVFIEMTNNAQLIQDGIDGDFQVMTEDGNVLFSGEIPTAKMAPKTKIRYPIQWTHETVEEGNYQLSINIDVNNEQIQATEPFTIGNEQINEYIERTQPVVPQATQKEEGIPIWVWIIAGAIILAGLMFWLGGRKRR